MYEIVFTEEALRAYRKADSPLARKLNRCFDNLAEDPRSHPNIKRLTGTLRGRFRYRVGDWRVVYRVDDKVRRITILVIAHRSGVYD
ncbi:MAG: type II toxin-antitoxin system RelE/ParE family toxin [Planctomycetes bacterium]|nr:type II toxin-antitoxin system RelE/ParE family toxin [Planctomycetota bacterium]MBU4400431.1 type II toxin-antitoxin system RelE/ParE family toxin [Planctomycetota bacterium]MCG2682910.1 type II toxin-antitoxin system RelE/ParE family toxin [Planctomycetales bacterium]